MNLGSDGAQDSNSEAETFHVAAEGSEPSSAIRELYGFPISVFDLRKPGVKFDEFIDWRLFLSINLVSSSLHDDTGPHVLES